MVLFALCTLSIRLLIDNNEHFQIIGIILSGWCIFYAVLLEGFALYNPKEIYILPIYFKHPVLLIFTMLAILFLISIIWILPSCALLRGIKHRRERLFLPWIVIMILHTPFTIHSKYCGWRMPYCVAKGWGPNDFWMYLTRSYNNKIFLSLGYWFECSFPFLIIIPQLIVSSEEPEQNQEDDTARDRPRRSREMIVIKIILAICVVLNFIFLLYGILIIIMQHINPNFSFWDLLYLPQYLTNPERFNTFPN